MAKKEKVKKTKGEQAPVASTAPTEADAAANTAPAAAVAVKAKKEKKAKDKPQAQQQPNQPMTPEMIAQQQLEQAIRESTDPSARLKKIRSPFNWKSILLSLLILIVVTIGIFYLWAYIKLDKFNFKLVTFDMFDKVGLTWLFDTIGGWFK